jgi:hypothetical protein
LQLYHKKIFRSICWFNLSELTTEKIDLVRFYVILYFWLKNIIFKSDEDKKISPPEIQNSKVCLIMWKRSYLRYELYNYIIQRV